MTNRAIAVRRMHESMGNVKFRDSKLISNCIAPTENEASKTLDVTCIDGNQMVYSTNLYAGIKIPSRYPPNTKHTHTITQRIIISNCNTNTFDKYDFHLTMGNERSVRILSF